MSAAPTGLSTGTKTLREAVARLVDPDAHYNDIPDVRWAKTDLQRRELAYQKADAIIGLLHPAQASPDRGAIALALINETRTFHGLDAIDWDFPALSTANKTRALRQADAIIATLPAQPTQPAPEWIDPIELKELYANSRPVQGGKGEVVATPQEVQEACAMVADRAAAKLDEKARDLWKQRGEFEARAARDTAYDIAESIRALIPPAAPQPASNAGGTEATLKMVAGMFAESVHETYTREEVVSVVEDMIRVGHRDPATPQAAKLVSDLEQAVSNRLSDCTKGAELEAARNAVLGALASVVAYAGNKPIGRQWIVDLIRDQFDPAPAHYKLGDNWDDGAEAIAEAVLGQLPLLRTESVAIPSTQNSPPPVRTSHNSGEKLPNGDAAGGGGEAVPSTNGGSGK